MSAPLVIPPRSPGSTRSEDEHVALYRLYIVEGRSAEDVAGRLTAMFPDRPMTRAAVTGYAIRQGWGKHEDTRGGNLKLSPPEKPIKVAPSTPGPKSAFLVDLDPVIGQRQIGGEWHDVCERSCRFPVGERPPAWRMADQLFCGEAAAHGEQYCDRHCRVAYPPAALAKRREANAAKN